MRKRKLIPVRTSAALRKTSDVDQRLRDLQRYYDVGCASLKTHPDRLPYENASTLAAEYGLSQEAFRKARAFASKYSRDDVQQLFRLCTEHGFALRECHIVRLVTLPRKQRISLQRSAIEGKWTRRKLDAEIRLKMGNRRPLAGRRSRSLLEPDDARYELQRLCEKWQRFYDDIKKKRKTSIPRSGEAEIFSTLTPKIQKAIEDIETAIAALLSLKIYGKRPTN